MTHTQISSWSPRSVRSSISISFVGHMSQMSTFINQGVKTLENLTEPIHTYTECQTEGCTFCLQTRDDEGAAVCAIRFSKKKWFNFGVTYKCLQHLLAVGHSIWKAICGHICQYMPIYESKPGSSNCAHVLPVHIKNQPNGKPIAYLEDR